MNEMKPHQGNEAMPKKDLTDSKLEKLLKTEDLKQKVKQLREERIARHAARLDLLKKKKIEKYSNQLTFIPTFKKNGSGDLSKVTNGPKQSSSNISFKSSNDKLTLMVSKATSTTTILNHGDPPAASKPLSTLNKNKYSNVEKRVDCHMRIIPKSSGAHSTKSSKLPKADETHLTKVKLSSTEIQIQQKKDISRNESASLKDAEAKKISSMNPNNILKKPDMSFLERLSRPKFISTSSTTLPPKKPKTLPVKPKSGHDIAQNKRWTLASVERLSRPKTVSHTVLPQKPVTSVPISKNGFKAPNVQEKNKPIQRRVTDVHKSNDNSKTKLKQTAILRRSLSTVHFKRMGPDAVKKCLKRTLSVGNLKQKDIGDEDSVDFPPKEYILPVESERKKSVKFLTPLRKTATPPMFLNTPKPSELRQRLNDWLQKRGKTLSNFHHLHCFGIHSGHLAKKTLEPMDEKLDDENKENEEIIDDDSFNEGMTGHVKDVAAEWRQANQTPEWIPISKDLSAQKASDHDRIGALDDLHRLILEGYSWKQCAEWLRLIARSSGPEVTETATYWECRAALEDMRGDFSTAVECYKKAIMQGAQPNVVDVSLDLLLEKFMKLNINAENKQNDQVADSKFLDVKNVFKTTIIRFAIQEKNMALCQSKTGSPKSRYVATPVRRSFRLSQVPQVSATKTSAFKKTTSSGVKKQSFASPSLPLMEKKKTPNNNPLRADTPFKSERKSTGRQHLVQLCSSLQNVDDKIRNSMVFVPNKALNFNDC